MRTGRPAKGEITVYLRLPKDTLRRLDQEVERLRVSGPGMSGVRRVDLMRDLLVAAADRLPAPKDGEDTED